jgi:hypothetical protein
MPPAGKATVGLAAVLLTLGLAMILSCPARTFSQPSHIRGDLTAILLVIGDQWDPPAFWFRQGMSFMNWRAC